jgi:hypothetical protein
MVGAQPTGKPVEGSIDHRLLIHRHRLSQIQVAGRHRVVKVDEQCLEAVLWANIDERIVLEVLNRLKIALVCMRDKADGIDEPRLQILEGEIKTLDLREDDLVQVGEPFACTVVAGLRTTA